MQDSTDYSSLRYSATGSPQKIDVAQYMNNNYLFDPKFKSQVSGVTDFNLNTPIDSFFYTESKPEPLPKEEVEEVPVEEDAVEEGVVDPVFASATPLGSGQWENFPEVLSGMQFAPMQMQMGAMGFGGSINALGGAIGGAPVMGGPRMHGTFNPFQSQFNQKDLPEFLQSMMEDTPEYLR